MNCKECLDPLKKDCYKTCIDCLDKYCLDCLHESRLILMVDCDYCDNIWCGECNPGLNDACECPECQEDEC